jgi:hypothetical protein
MNKLHHVDGELPVYPQAVAIKYTPEISKRTSEWLSGCVNYHHKEQTKSHSNETCYKRLFINFKY